MGNSFSRRDFLRTGLFGLAGATMLGPGIVSGLAANSEPVEAVVIGSGFGGAVAALRLAQAGVRTLMLERGRRWTVTPEQNTFATLPNPDGRAAWLSPTTVLGAPSPIDVYTGVLERQVEDGVTVYAGAGVGGGSLVYNGVTYQPTRELFERSFGGAVRYDEMEEVFYPRVRSMLNPSQLPADILSTEYYRMTRVFLEMADRAGLRGRLADMNIDWNVVRGEIEGSRVPSALVGEFWYGNNSGCKNSLDKNYLAQAEASGRLEIMPLTVVTEITEAPGNRYLLTCDQIDESGATRRRLQLTCNRLFLAAGSMGTSKMLVKAKAKGTLSKLNEHVGRGWGNNGDFFGMQVGLPDTNPSQGGPASAVIEDHANPLGPTAVMCAPQWDAQGGVINTLGLSIPPAKGVFRYDAATDSVKLNWPGDDPAIARTVEAGARTYDTLNRANTTSSQQPSTAFVAGGLTAHPLGGAVLGRACDRYGRVEGYKNLYVVDGSLIPGSSGCTNPSFTIAALAERCMEKIVPEVVEKGDRKLFALTY
jgi:cholesterol oxidase